MPQLKPGFHAEAVVVLPVVHDTPEYLGVIELAAALAMHHRTVRQLVKAGDAPGYRIGGKLKFKLAEVIATLKAKHEIPAATQN